MDFSKHQDQDSAGNTQEDVDSALRYRDELLTDGMSGADAVHSTFAPPTLDGATLLFSRYGFRDTAWLRVIDAVWLQDSDESDLANLSRSLKRLPLIASVLAGTASICLSVPGIFNQFAVNNQLTVWRTREMAKRQAFDHVLWSASKLAVTVTIKSYFLTTGFLYLPFLVTAYRGKTSFWEHAACFSLTLGLFCLPRGPVPMMVGSAVGLSFGALYGSVYYLFAKNCGCTYEELCARRS